MNIIKSDFYRLFRTGMFWIIFALTCVCGVVFIAIAYFLEKGTIGVEVIGTAPILMDTMILTIMCPIVIAAFICSDFQNKTVYASVLYGKGRNSVIRSRFLPFSFIVFMMTLPYIVSSYVVYLTNNKVSKLFAQSVDSMFLKVLANEEGLEHDAALFFKFVIIMLAAAIMVIARMSPCLIVAYGIKKPLPVVGICVFMELFLSILPVMGLSSEAFQNILKYTPFCSGSMVFMLSMDWGDIFRVILVSLVFIVIVYFITARMFKKSEIK